MALSQGFSLVGLGHDRLASYQQRPSLLLHIATVGQAQLAGKLLITRVEVYAGPDLGLRARGRGWLFEAFSNYLSAFFELVADGRELLFLGELQVRSGGVERLGVDFDGMVFGAIGPVLSDLFLLEITCTVLLNSQALLRDGHAELSLPVLFFLLLRLLALATASPLVVLMNSFLLLITFLFFWKMCLSITK